MARPKKEGLDYFPHDTDADSDEKIQAMIYLYGNDGYAFYFRLLQRIYRTPAGELDISDHETRKILAGNLNLTVRKFNQMLKTSFKKGLFDLALYESSGRLSSISIKVRLQPVLESREAKRILYAQKGVVLTGETTEKSRRNPGETLQRQSKYKDKDKEKESKENNDPLPPTENKSLSPSLNEDDVLEITNNEKIPTMPGEIAAACKKYTPEWVRDAIKQAVIHEKRQWNYVAGVLAKCLEEGHAPGGSRKLGGNKGPPGKDGDDPDKYIKGPFGHLVHRQ